jgi:hypothetical protein
MKTSIKTNGLTLILAFALFSCDQENNPSPNQAITNDEAAEEVAGFLSTDVSGSSADLPDLAKDAQNGRLAANGRTAACGIAYDTMINRSFSGTYLSFNYSLEYIYNLSCTNAGVPSTLSYSITTNGVRSGNRLESQGTSNGTLSAAGFEISQSSYTVNGSFNRTHTVTQKSASNKTFNSQLETTLSDLSVNKSTKIIEGGTASISASGTSSSGGSYTYTASVVFNGDGTANVAVNSDAYLVNTKTGQVSKE